MKLTKKKAIELSIEKWEDLAKMGNPDWNWHEEHDYPKMACDCPFCEYSIRQRDANCESCPYFQKFGDCCEEDSPYDNWSQAGTPAKRKRYALEFLEQLKQL